MTAIKVNGQQDSDTAVVTVVDTIGPALNPSGINIGLDVAGQASITVADIDQNVSDACGLDSVYLSKYTFDCNDVGNNNINIIAVDVNGNLTSSTAVVGVADTISPAITVNNHSLTLDASGMGSILLSDVSTSGADACGMDSIYLSQYNFSCADAGLNTVQVSAIDVNGNTTIKPVQVTVKDTTPPVISTMNYTLFLDGNGSGSIAPADVASDADACGIDTIILDRYNFSCADIGSHSVHITATDVAGNQAMDSAVVSVSDTVSPIVSATNVNVYLDI
ncbi:MAG: hypothetical protein U5L96_17420 [Owenweeksia sp.]|nr:hypothetical protein [Owenweeksia sp.]